MTDLPKRADSSDTIISDVEEMADQIIRQRAGVARLRQVAQLLDSAVRIPFTPWRIGVDGIIGLIPGVGDMAGAVLAGSIVVQALRLGAPAGLLARMLTNVAIDALVGEIPIIGDLFDIGFKVNLRNVDLLERHLADPHGAKAAGNQFLLLVLLMILVIVVATAALALGVIVLLLSLAKHLF